MIGPDQIDVWYVSINATGEAVESLSASLSAHERERALRYRFDEDRLRAMVSRGALRALLAHYTDHEPSALEIIEGHRGKPMLRTPSIEFSVSHAADFVALAFARSSPIGIDIERIRPMEDAKRLASNYYSLEERGRLNGSRDYGDAFLDIWTAKEAVVKASGDGIGAALPEFSVPAAAVGFEVVSGFEQWSVCRIDPPASGYRVAVAARSGTQWRMDIRTSSVGPFLKVPHAAY